MYTEFWTLYCCAVRLCLRVRYAVDKTLPVRLRHLALTPVRADVMRYAWFRYAVGVPV